MRSVTYRLIDLQFVEINLGFVGENKHTKVIFDCKKMFDQYPNAIAFLSVTPPQGDVYPAVTTREGDFVSWEVTASDLVYDGSGKIQLTFMENDKIAKTYECKTSISPSSTPAGNPPSVIENYIQEVNQKIVAAEEATREAKAAAEHQPIIDDNGNWNIWDNNESAYVDTGIKAQGENGAPGHDGHDGQDGKDGEDGAPGQPGTDATPDLITKPYSQLIFPVAKGTQCYHDGKLYEANQAIQTSEQWTAAHWTETNVEEQLNTVKSDLQAITEEHISKNLYDKTACDPADGKAYWDGSRNTAATYATTGKIPVEAETQYVFYAGGANVKYVEYFSGETGSTFLSRLTINNEAFTTPAGCTYVAIMLFAASHTTEQYNNAMAVAQLNKGSTVQPYEPYGNSIFVPLNAVEDGDKLSSVSSATVIQSQINLYDKSLATDQQSIYQNERVTNAKQANTGLIPVEPNTQYCLSRDPSTPLAIVAKVWEFNASRQYTGFLQTELGNYSRNYSISFKTSATTKFIGINMELDPHTTQNFKDTIDSLMLCYGTQRPAEYSAYNPETVLLASRISNAFYANADRFKGKRWLALGTSVTWYDSCKYQSGLHTGEVCRGYVGNVARRKPLSVFNNGIAGSTLGNVDANSLINRYQSISWTDYDIVTIEFGINDFGYDIPVGSESDAAGTDTFAACLRTVIEYAMSQNHKLNIVICTEPDVRGSQQNNNNNTLSDYADITIAIATKYRLPVCDWFYHSGINNWNRGNASYDYLTADGTHPNNEGHMRMGAMLNQVFDNLYC